MKQFLFILLFFLSLAATAQQHEIKGKVTEKATGESLPGVSVVISGTSRGVATAIDGSWHLSAGDKDVLVFSFVGMKEVRVPVAGKRVINVVMEPDAVEMDEVMVVAYGTAKKESFTGSAEVVGGEQLEKRAVSNISKAIDGVVAGVQSSSGSGRPGAGASIIIRGVGSINAATTPLYVVDGVPFEGNINSLNPNDIESMSVLKDASASALYGARGANGVVMITTKRGRAGKTELNFKATVGLVQRAIPQYDMMNAAEFMEANYDYTRFVLISGGADESSANQLALSQYMEKLGGEEYNPFTVASGELIDPSTGKVVDGASLKWQDDWLDEAMRNTPVRQEYLLSARGGNERTQYLLSVGYLNEQGLAEKSGFDRISARVNVDSRLKDWCKVGISSAFSLTNSDNIPSSGNSSDNVWYSAQTIGPIYPLYMRDAATGQLLLKDGNKQYDYGEKRPYLKSFNPVALLSEDQNSIRDDNMSARGYIELGDKKNEQLGFLKDLKLTVNAGMDYKLEEEKLFYNPFTGNAVNSKGKMTQTQTRALSYTVNELLNYTRKFGLHELDVLAGHEYYDSEESALIGARTGFIFTDVSDLNSGATVSNANSSTNRYRVMSFLSRVNYSFADKYYFSGSFRTDGSSRFHKDNRWGSFWSVGASWRMSQERFLNGAEWLDNLTVKLSYGQQGNDAINAYNAWQRTYKYGYSNGDYPGVLISQLENKNLKWEKNNNLNFGVEGKFFRSRLAVSVELFYKKTTDMLLFRALPLSSGYNGVFENVGDMDNKGFDLTLSGVPVMCNGFTWTATLLASKYKNKVTALAKDQKPIISGAQVIKVGEPIYSFYLLESAGVDPANGDQLYWVENEKTGERSTTNSSVGATRELMGSRIPQLFGSFTNSFSWKGFDLSVMLTYSLGGKVLDSNYATLTASDTYGRNWHTDMNRRWRTSGDVTDIPRLENGYQIETTDRNLFSASYLGVKNVSLGYTLRLSDKSSQQFSSLRFSLTGDNLYTVTSLRGMDPQFNFTGGQGYTYASVRTWNFGVDLTF